MDIIHELYDAFAHSLEAEETLSTINEEFTGFIESNISPDEKAFFFDTVESLIRNREQYFFQAGFQTAKDLLLK